MKKLLIGLLLLLSSCQYFDSRTDEEIFFDFFEFSKPADVNSMEHEFHESIDADYWIAFTCDSTTVQKIRAKLNLSESSKPDWPGGGLCSEPTLWWDMTFIRKARVYSRYSASKIQYLWYDKLNKKAYFTLILT